MNEMFAPTIVKHAEETLRIASGSAELYGVLHHPAPVDRGAVLLCPADGEERAWCLRTYVDLARSLAELGFWVLRFDYAGQGESSGSYEDGSVETRVRDLASSLRVLVERSGHATAAVVGARLGGSLALEAAVNNPHVECLVLIEPVLDCGGYARNLLRINLSMQMVMHEKVIRNSDQLLEDLAAGGRVGANGYNLSGPFISGLQTLQPAQRLTQVAAPVLIVMNPATRLPESPAEISRLAFPPFWKEPKADMTPPDALITHVIAWLQGRFSGERL